MNIVWQEKFVGLNFRYQTLEAYFCGLIFVVCPVHVIIVAYCPRLAATIRMSRFLWVNFSF